MNTEPTTPSGGLRGVLLMTYGSPDSLDDVPRYLAAVRGGRAAPDELVTEFTRRYRVIGGSPLIAITRGQAQALERQLGPDYRVSVGMRFSDPSIAAGLEELSSAGVGEVAGIVLSPQDSALLMGGYRRAIEAAREAAGPAAPHVWMAGPWYLEPAFVQALADRIRDALDAFPPSERERIPVLLTAHSLPRRVADEEPDYLAQLDETARAVADAAGLSPERWTFCWQSAGHEPGEWMRPDFADLMPGLREAGHRSVLVAPVQFLADHLEILYDIDIGAREQAEQAGLAFRRIASLNDDAGLIAALAAVARRTLDQQVALVG